MAGIGVDPQAALERDRWVHCTGGGAECDGSNSEHARIVVEEVPLYLGATEAGCEERG